MNIIPIVIICIVFWIIAIWALVDDGPLSVVVIYGIFALCTTVILICNFSHFFCSNCDFMVGIGSDYCIKCGHELQPHCAECGEICRTAFCKLCGAEQ